VELVRRGLAPTRERAQADIAAGRVLVAGSVADKPARMVAAADPIRFAGPPARFVSRGGEKLDAALAGFGIGVAGRTALDAGASTGGFTDCLLQRGAACVVAVDVGHGQLDLRLRDDPRVEVMERTNVRDLTVDALAAAPFDVVTADLAFVSLRTVAPVLISLVAPGGDVVVLVTPQFEAGPAEVSKGKGVIRDPEVWHRAVVGVRDAFAAGGAAMMGLMVSPLRGAEGNVEFLAHLRPGPDGVGLGDHEVAAVIGAAIGEDTVG
jgi:23S rRNA (cytidine1920-2'-O)/16S rRNA (cytidine1409-2'-O)-methyltransferase